MFHLYPEEQWNSTVPSIFLANYCLKVHNAQFKVALPISVKKKISNGNRAKTKKMSWTDLKR